MGSSREIKLKEDFRENDAVNTKHFDPGLYFTQLKDTAVFKRDCLPRSSLTAELISDVA